MGDLAKFVAATIRDKVVHEQLEEIHNLESQLQTSQRENEKLRHQLLVQKPVKSISIHGSNNILYASANMNVLTFQPDDLGPFCELDDIHCSIDELLAIEFRIDGRLSKRLVEMDCQGGNYLYCDITCEYIACVEFSCPGLTMTVYLSPFVPDSYEKLTGFSETPIPASNVGVRHLRFVRPIDVRRLEQFFDTPVRAKISFDDGDFECTPEFVRADLQKLSLI